MPIFRGRIGANEYGGTVQPTKPGTQGVFNTKPYEPGGALAPWVPESMRSPLPAPPPKALPWGEPGPAPKAPPPTNNPLPDLSRLPKSYNQNPGRGGAAVSQYSQPFIRFMAAKQWEKGIS